MDQIKKLKKGTKNFSGGTKVYIIDWYPGMCETIVVVGLHRKTKRIISVCIKANLVENLRIKNVYKKHIIRKVKERHGEFDQQFIKELAEEMLEFIPMWKRNFKNFSDESNIKNLHSYPIFNLSISGIFKSLKKLVIKRKP